MSLGLMNSQTHVSLLQHILLQSIHHCTIHKSPSCVLLAPYFLSLLHLANKQIERHISLLLRITLYGPGGISTFKPHREPWEPHRLHFREGPCVNRAAWPPQDPPTGTPKNGKRASPGKTTARVIVGGGPAQVLTPPASQVQSEAVVESIQEGVETPPSPTPALAIAAGSLSELVAVVRRSISPLLQTPATLVRPLFRVDHPEEHDAPGFAPYTTTPTQMNEQDYTLPPQTLIMSRSGTPVLTQEVETISPLAASTSPTSSALTVPAPEISNQSTQISAIPQDTATNDEVQHLRAQRRTLTTQLNTTTACTHRLRNRISIERGNLLAAQVLTDQARADRDTAREALMDVKKDASHWKRILLLLVVVVMMYVIWCWWMSEEFVYIRRRRIEKYGSLL